MAENKAKLINGISFLVLQPYAAGQVLTEAEAKALNQVRSENIGNNMREAVKKAQAEGKSEAEIQAMVAEYDAAYVFNLASVRQSAVKLDPVEREALAIAKEQVKAHLLSKGRKLTTVPEGMTKEEWEDKLAATVESVASNPAVIEEAKKAVKAKQKRAEALAGALGDIAG